MFKVLILAQRLISLFMCRAAKWLCHALKVTHVHKQYETTSLCLRAPQENSQCAAEMVLKSDYHSHSRQLYGAEEVSEPHDEMELGVEHDNVRGKI